jgi:Na+/H+-dicarboxylate symporter
VGLWFPVPLWRSIIAALRVGFMLPLDRVLDMIRTAPDNSSDLAVAIVVARWENEMDVEVFKSVRDV